ncbi:lipid transfer protein 3 [Cinnamomum micranthum f. kanehirae]|uniref:Non-specific lipid-transfer protein n=1 Tax=Cinnamomum micranthum f. kanehirae TaxID=337451 RepID=A0A443PN67_9MAGN|nr:lipid transfer protein 3 [Cinnamomum micranthum f. kanehirae]
MARSIVVVALAGVMLACLLACAPYAEGAVSCGQVVSSLTPCVSYLRSGGALPGACCSGVRTLNKVAKTTPDRQAACSCMKQAAAAITGATTNTYAQGLPGKCGVHIPYNISPSTDCSKVK